MNHIRTKFISPEGEKGLRSYKYSGADYSLIYKHILGPFAEWAVKTFIPEWMAPNVITLIGFSCSILSHLLVLALFPSIFGGDVPAWICVLAAILHLIYMNLDNMDGKQARKTGNSSPLGLLFDHGCDAMTTWVTGMTLFTVLQFGNGWVSMFSYIIVMVPFFCATWEEFYIDGLYLPIINGPNEGSLGLITLFIVSAVTGCGMWLNSPLGITNGEIVFWAFCIMAIFTVIGNFRNVYKKGGADVLRKASFSLITISYMTLTMVITLYGSYSDVYAKLPRVFLYFVGFSFAKLVGHLQASHVAGEPFNQFRKSIWFSFTVWNINIILGAVTKGSNLNEEVLLYCLLAFAIIVHMHFVINIINQFTEVLQIRVFKVKPKDSVANENMKLNQEPQTSYKWEALPEVKTVM
jgi:ethanolaminephosphotransferase